MRSLIFSFRGFPRFRILVIGSPLAEARGVISPAQEEPFGIVIPPRVLSKRPPCRWLRIAGGGRSVNEETGLRGAEAALRCPQTPLDARGNQITLKSAE